MMSLGEFCDNCINPNMICLSHPESIDVFETFPYSDDDTDVSSNSSCTEVSDDQLTTSEYDKIVGMLFDAIVALENSMNQIKRLNADSTIGDTLNDAFLMLDLEIAMMRTIVDKKKGVSAEFLGRGLDDISDTMHYVL